MSSWSPLGGPGSEAGFVLTEGAGWDRSAGLMVLDVCSQDENGRAGFPLLLSIPVS